MKNPTIIIFTGLPGTGKTTMSRQIAEKLTMPLIAKDDIKEIMFDNLGWSDKAWSAKLAHATFGIMDYMTEQNLKTGRSVILEANYSPSLSSERFQRWQKIYACNIIQIICRTDIDVLAKRFAERTQNNRHPGHLDTGTVESHLQNFQTRIENGDDQPLSVKGPVQVIDTTDFNNVDVDEIAAWIIEAMSKDSKTTAYAV